MNQWVTLSNGLEMPLLGLGIYTPHAKNEAREAVATALDLGYRLLDNASAYQNEEEVGQGLQDSGLARAEVFITSKVNNPEQGYDATLRAFDNSLQRLQTDYLDLYLIHWPVREHRRQTWQALEKLYADKRVKAIGVSNYYQPHLEELFTYAEVVPMVNQFEFHPFLYLPDLVNYCFEKGIQPEGYSPLVRGEKAQHPTLQEIAERHGKSTYQVLIRWSMQHGVVTIPKSTNPERLRANFDVWDFELSDDDIAALNQLHDGTRIAEDPMDYL
ncbi:glyoxal/methylglyoxal reductase [Rhabdobacter roseus]|uniref:Diketogulonate reductase-like aldo/keto reductase n=1 Tax=Rhabdobacter roseus TaxID=1655419 RepID=A0A840TGL5_9BACT|nr:aldo/keto reductase [Rhabdobacter roseus]MBB5283296.1 diketogulonate reductase-like aldo/keto reductase [Rhabdobacter roseus]